MTERWAVFSGAQTLLYERDYSIRLPSGTADDANAPFQVSVRVLRQFGGGASGPEEKLHLHTSQVDDVVVP